MFSHGKPSGQKLNLDERFISAVILFVKPTFPVSPVKPYRAGSFSSCSLDTVYEQKQDEVMMSLEISVEALSEEMC